MAVPARVAADAAAADVTLQQLAQAARDGALEQPAPGPPQPTNPTPPPAPPVAEIAPLAPAPAPVPQPPTAQPVDTNVLLQQLQQQVQSLSGRLANEVTERQRAQEQLRLAQTQPPAPAPAPPAPTPVPVSDAERTEFGPETVEFISKIAQHFAAQSFAQVGSRLAQIEGRLNATHQRVEQVAQVEQQTLAERYLAALNSAVPDWETINVSDKFLGWLQNVDLSSNKAYMELLQDAHEQGQSGRVIHIFNLYKQQNGLAVASPTPTPTPAPANPPGPLIDPATLAAPNTTAPAPPPSGQQPQGRTWTMAEVDKLYADYQNKRISKQVFEAQEQEYLKALAEGRVQ